MLARLMLAVWVALCMVTACSQTANPGDPGIDGNDTRTRTEPGDASSADDVSADHHTSDDSASDLDSTTSDAPDTSIEDNGAADFDSDTDVVENDESDAGDVFEPDIPAVCGDEVVVPPEACDDGNEISDDGCDECILTGEQEILIQIRSVSSESERFFIALDGGGLSEPSVLSLPVRNHPIDYVRYPVGEGGAYRVRVLSVVGTRFPTVVRGGVATGLEVPAHGAVGAMIDLEAATVSRGAATPRAVLVGEPYTIQLAVHDPAQSLTPHTSGRVWLADSPFDDLDAEQHSGRLDDLGGGDYMFTIDLVAGNPNLARTIYYQFGESAADFNNGDSEVPFIVGPSVRLDRELFQLDVAPANSGMLITVTDIPAEADRVFLNIDGGKNLIEALLVDDVPVEGTAVFDVGTIAGEGYRVRAIATVGEGTFPIVLEGGQQRDIVVPLSPRVEVTVPLRPYGFVVSSPAEVPVGNPIGVAISIVDPADFLEDLSSARLYWNDDEMATDLDGNQHTGSFTRVEPGHYQSSALLPPAGAQGTRSVQFAESSAGAFGRVGTVAPFLALPTLALSEEPIQVTIGPPAQGVELTVNDIPAEAGRVVAVLDNDETSIKFHEDVDTESVVMTLGAPAGAYRLRVVAFDLGPRFPPVLGGAYTSEVLVEDGEYVPSTLGLTAPEVRVVAPTPESAAPSSEVTFHLEITDPADFLNETTARLYTASEEGNNLTGSQHRGTLTPAGGDLLQYEVSFTTPAELGTVHYQFGESGGSAFMFDGQPPFIVGPNRDLGESLFELEIR